MEGSNSSSTPQQHSSLASTLAGMGLFVATAAVSQWIQLHYANQQQQEQQRISKRRRRRRRRKANTSCDEDWYSCNTSDGEALRNLMLSKDAFRRMRIARRMSFEQVDDQDQQKASRRSSLSNSNRGEESLPRGYQSMPPSPAVKKEAMTEWSLHRAMGDLTSSQGRWSNELMESQHAKPGKALEKHRRKKTTNHSRADKEHKAPPHPDQNAPMYRYHDFHPKYQNWRHFEHFNEHDRAKQRRKSQRLRQQQEQEIHQEQQQLQEQPHHYLQCSYQLQMAGEGASQKDDEEKRRKSASQNSGGRTIDNNPVLPIRRHHRSQTQQQNGSDNDSISTFDNDKENTEKRNTHEILSESISSFDSGNEYVWAGGTKAKDPFGPNVPDDPLNLNRLAIVSGTTGAFDAPEGASSGSSAKKNTNRSNSSLDPDHRMGKFQRFYRMLASSIIDDDSNLEDTNKISISSESTNYGSSASSDYDGDIEDRHRALRTEYNAQIMPEKLVLIRHGQSMGNVDETIYATTPDNAMPLTDLGWEQGRKAGMILKDKIIAHGESVHFIVSPYVRTVETFHGIVSAWCDPESEEFASITDRNRKVNAWYERLTELGLTWNEDSRIREQDFGNYQNPEHTKRAKEERHRFGAFYYRFHNGESGSDVYDRVSTFLDSLWRSFETNKSENYVLVTHGIVLRVLMARYFRYTITQLNTLANPRNCEMVVLGHEGNGRLDLEGRCSLELEEDPETGKKIVKGYKFHKRLRVLPKSNIRTVRFRISPMDHGNV